MTALRERFARGGPGLSLRCARRSAAHRVGRRRPQGAWRAPRGRQRASRRCGRRRHGHSARDVLELLREAGVTLEAKPFALGVRIEHPQPLVNQIQYGRTALHPKLPNASYRLAAQIDGRGVFSFCMCPGGWIVPASTEPGALVVNGMSLARRDSPFANSGLVVQLEPRDWEAQGFFWARSAASRCSAASSSAAFSGRRRGAPRARLPRRGFRRRSQLERHARHELHPGYRRRRPRCGSRRVRHSARRAHRRALVDFNRSMRGYLTNEAVLVGVESRTSSPVRVPRHPETLESARPRWPLPRWRGRRLRGWHRQRGARRHARCRARRRAPHAVLSVRRVISAGAARRIGGPQ